MTNTKRSISFLVFAATLAQAPLAARAASTSNGDTVNGTNTATIAAPTTNTGTAPGNINQAAKSASSSNMIGMVANGVAAAGWFAASFTPTMCSNAMFCAMSAMSLAQMAVTGAAKSGADDTAAATNYQYDTGGGAGTGLNGGGSYGDPGSPTLSRTTTSRGTGLDGSSVFSPEQQRQLSNIQSQLKAAGYIAGKDGTVTMPDGKKVSGASLGSAAGMRAAGMSDAQIAEASAVAAKNNDLIKKQLKIMGLEEGGGGGGGSGGAGGGKSVASGHGGGAYGNLFGKGKKNVDARSAAGMTKQLSGDKIGASGDDIFQMVSRQYIRRDRENEFLK